MSPTAATRARTNKAAEAPAEPAAPAETENQKRNRLRNEAERHILNLHKDEFADYAEALFKDNGLTFNRRLSEAEKAQRKIQELIEKHPELADALRAQLTVTVPEADPAEVPYEDAIEASVPTAPYEEVTAPTEEEYSSFAPTPGYVTEADPFHPNYQG